MKLFFLAVLCLMTASAQASLFNVKFLPCNTANGVACTDSGNKINVAQLPASTMIFKDMFDPTATPASPLLNGDGAARAGDIYMASKAGSYDFGAGAIAFQSGDFAIYNGSVYRHAPASTGVVSVNGYQGAVSLTSDDISVGSTNLYWTSTLFNSAFSGKTTDNLTQGSTNLYFSNSLARGAVSATSPLGYSSSTGVFTCQTASGSQAGCIASSDFSAFAGKQNALSFGNVTSTTTGVHLGGVPTGAAVGASGFSVDIDTATDSQPGLMSAADHTALTGAVSGSFSPYFQLITLVGGDITNQYVDMAVQCKANSVSSLVVDDSVAVYRGKSFTISVVGGNTRISFIGDLAAAGATPLAATDTLGVVGCSQ